MDKDRERPKPSDVLLLAFPLRKSCLLSFPLCRDTIPQWHTNTTGAPIQNFIGYDQLRGLNHKGDNMLISVTVSASWLFTSSTIIQHYREYTKSARAQGGRWLKNIVATRIQHGGRHHAPWWKMHLAYTCTILEAQRKKTVGQVSHGRPTSSMIS
jgi:hypothetical protein